MGGSNHPFVPLSTTPEEGENQTLAASNKSLQRSSITVNNVALAALAATSPPAIAAAELKRYVADAPLGD